MAARLRMRPLMRFLTRTPAWEWTTLHRSGICRKWLNHTFVLCTAGSSTSDPKGGACWATAPRLARWRFYVELGWIRACYLRLLMSHHRNMVFGCRGRTSPLSAQNGSRQTLRTQCSCSCRIFLPKSVTLFLMSKSLGAAGWMPRHCDPRNTFLARPGRWTISGKSKLRGAYHAAGPCLSPIVHRCCPLFIFGRIEV